MKTRLAILAVLALAVVGCGGAGGSSTSDAAGLAPAQSLAYVAIDTDFSSSQLKSAQSVLDKFPIKSRVLDAVRSGFASQGIDVNGLKAAIGPELDIAVLRAGDRTDAVGFTQPRDQKAFEAQLDKGSTLHERIGGWTVFSDKQALLDAVKNRKDNLSDDAAFQAAAKTWPDQALAKAFVSRAGASTGLNMAGGAIGGAGQQFGSAKWLAGALTSSDGAFKLEVHTKTDAKLPASGAGLADEIPSGSILALHLTGGGGAIPKSLRDALGGMTAQLGFDATALVDALDGPVVAYVRPGLPLPDVTIAAKPTDPKKTSLAIGQLIQRLTGGSTTIVPAKVEGGTLQKADLGAIAIYFGAAGDQVVVSDSANVLAELKGSVGHLTGDSAFKDAKDAAGMPDDGQGFLFVNVKDALPALSGFAQLANQKLPQGLEANLKPLRSLLVYGSRDGDIESLVAFLQTS